MASKILFLCAGEYGLSDYAATLFNRIADQEAISWQSSSRSVSTVPQPEVLHLTFNQSGETCDVTPSVAGAEVGVEDLARAESIVGINRKPAATANPGTISRVDMPNQVLADPPARPLPNRRYAG